jgi:hypothetical protein
MKWINSFLGNWLGLFLILIGLISSSMWIVLLGYEVVDLVFLMLQ